MLPKVNQHLFIQVASPGGEDSAEELKARIADVSAEAVVMEVPINTQTGRLKRLYVGDQLSVYYISEGGIKNYFTSEVLGFREETIRLVVIRSPDPEQVTKVQRRSYLRVPAELEVAVKLHGNLRLTALTDDVGGGGVSFITEGHMPFKSKETITGWLLLPYKNQSFDHMAFKAEVVRIKKLETGRQLIMCSFTDIADFERQKVIRYCFERQLEFRKL